MVFQPPATCVYSCDSNSDFEITSRCRDRIFDTRLRSHFGDQRCETWIICATATMDGQSQKRTATFGTFPPWLPWQPLEHGPHLLVKRSDPKTFGFGGIHFPLNNRSCRRKVFGTKFLLDNAFFPQWLFQETTLFFFVGTCCQESIKITKQPEDIISSHDVMSPWSWHCLVLGVSLWLGLPTWRDVTTDHLLLMIVTRQFTVARQTIFGGQKKLQPFGREEVVCFFAAQVTKIISQEKMRFQDYLQKN